MPCWRLRSWVLQPRWTLPMQGLFVRQSLLDHGMCCEPSTHTLCLAGSYYTSSIPMRRRSSRILLLVAELLCSARVSSSRYQSIVLNNIDFTNPMCFSCVHRVLNNCVVRRGMFPKRTFGALQMYHVPTFSGELVLFTDTGTVCCLGTGLSDASCVVVVTALGNARTTKT